MKLTVKRDSFLKALQKVINIIANRSTLPVLANVLMEARDQKLTITTTDLEIRISTTFDAEVKKPGTTTVPAKKLYALVSRFTDAEVDLDCNDKHHTNIVCGTSKFKILGLGAEDFPLPVEFAPQRTMKFKGSDFRRMIDQIAYAVSLDDTRKVLHGILISAKDNNATLVATDGKRLALIEKMPESFDGSDGDIIIPLKAASEIKRIIDNDEFVSLEFGEKQAAFKTEKAILTTKLIEGNFPNYRQVIPTRFNKAIEVPAAQLLSKLELVSLALSEAGSYIVVTLKDNQLQLQAASNNVGEGADYLTVDYDEAPLDISFNPIFLSDPLKHCDADTVKLKLNDGFSPVALEGGEGFLYVIMPMRNR